MTPFDVVKVRLQAQAKVLVGGQCYICNYGHVDRLCVHTNGVKAASCCQPVCELHANLAPACELHPNASPRPALSGPFVRAMLINFYQMVFVQIIFFKVLIFNFS